jgi:two-component system chemotaxis response regulator CheB
MENRGNIGVLVVDNSIASRMLLVQILNTDADIEVVGSVNSGQEALNFLAENSADVILMDINMPVMDGFETTRRIMETRAMPIIICSAGCKAVAPFRVMEAGAVACIEKPLGIGRADFDRVAAELVLTVKLMSEVKVVHRWPRRLLTAGSASEVKEKACIPIRMVGIGASTGGPPVLQNILGGLPKDFSVPVLIVQHIAPGFLPGLVEWLNQTTGVKVHIAGHGVEALPGHVYLAPDEFHMGVNAADRLLLSREEKDNGMRPSVSHLFHSLARQYGPAAIGVLLTGMGKDGAKELREMKDRGACTIAQDRETSVVHGMPGEAIALGGATYVLSPDTIAPMLIATINRHTIRTGAGYDCADAIAF